MHHTSKRSGRMAFLGLILLALIAALAMLVVACGGDKEELKIGFLGDYTGDLSEFGPNMEHGAQLAAKQINDAGGILGQDIVLKTADSQTKPAPGVEAARQLVDVEGVQAVVGALSSGVTLAVASGVTVPDGIIQISPASTSTALTEVEDNDLLFRIPLSDEGQGAIMAQMAKELGYKKVSTLYVNNAYGEGLSEAFATAFVALGGAVPAQVPHEQEQTSYLAELQKATADKPDALAALSYPQSATVYIKEAIENNLAKTFIFCDGTKSEDIIKAVGAAPLEGMHGTVSAPSEIPAAWKSEFEAEYGELPPLPYIAESYDAVVMIALGAAKAGSTDPAEIRDAMRTLNDPDGEKINPGADGIKKALDLIKDGKAINYQGASGFSGWDENGDVPSGFIEIWKIEGGKIVTVRTEPVTLE